MATLQMPLSALYEMVVIHNTLSPALKLFIQEANRTVESTRHVHDVADYMDKVVSIALGTIATQEAQNIDDLPQGAPVANVSDVVTSFPSAYQLCVRESSQYVSWIVACAFYWSSFEQLADVLLSVVSVDWLPQLAAHGFAGQQLLSALFALAPAPLAFATLVGHISQVAPSGPHSFTSATSSVTAAGSATAVQLLSDRFVASGASGLLELVAYMAAERSRSTEGTAGCDTSSVTATAAQPAGTAAGAQTSPVLLLPSLLPWHNSSASSYHHQHHYRHHLLPTEPDALATWLVSVPDKLATVSGSHPELQHNAFYTSILRTLLQATGRPAAALTAVRDGVQNARKQAALVHGHLSALSECSHMGLPTCKGMATASAQVAYAMSERLCRRGAAQVVADVLLNVTMRTDSPLASSASDGAAGMTASATPASNSSRPAYGALLGALLSAPQISEKLLVALLSAAASASPFYSSMLPYDDAEVEASQPRPDKASTSNGSSSSAATTSGSTWVPNTPQVHALHVLLSHPSVTGSLEVQYLMCEGLLCHKAALSGGALRLLVDLIGVLAWPEGGGGEEEHRMSAMSGVGSGNGNGAEVGWWEQLVADAAQGGCGAAPAAGCAGSTRGSTHDNQQVRVSQYVHVACSLSQLWGEVASSSTLLATAVTSGAQFQSALKHQDEAAATTAHAGTRLPLQAYQSCAIVAVLLKLSRREVERAPGLLPGLLAGVSARLASPQTIVRRQGMRVGKALSMRLAPKAGAGVGADSGDAVAAGAPGPLFGDQGALWLTPEELWPGALPQLHTTPPPHPTTPSTATGRSTQMPTAPAAGATSTAVGAGPGVSGQPGSDDESDSDDDSLEAYDVREDPVADEWKALDPSKLQLRAVIAALRKQDDVKGVLEALGRVELVIRAAPEELAVAAHDLARSLVFCRVPEWAEAEANSPEPPPNVQRVRALAALASMSPLPAGDALVGEVLSPNLDTYQRLLILDSLSAAAMEMAHPESAPKLAFSSAGNPVLSYPAPEAQPSLPSPSSSSPSPRISEGGSHRSTTPTGTSASTSSGPAPPGMRAASTRVWGHAALARQAKSRPAPRRNRFAEVALRWATGLMREVDVVRQGVDLLQRDTLVLGRLLSTLASFAEASEGTPAAPQLAAAVLELLASPRIHGHPEAYVRRNALLAAGGCLAVLPAPSLAGALVGHSVGQAADSGVVERLQWMQGWLGQVAAEDGDQACRAMASAALQLHKALATEALGALTAPPQTGALAGGAMLPGVGPAAVAAALGLITGVPPPPPVGLGVHGTAGPGAGGLVTGPLGSLGRAEATFTSPLLPSISVLGAGSSSRLPGSKVSAGPLITEL